MITINILSRCHEYEGPDWQPEPGSKEYVSLSRLIEEADKRPAKRLASDGVMEFSELDTESQWHILRRLSGKTKIHWAYAEGCKAVRGSVHGMKAPVQRVSGLVFNRFLKDAFQSKVCKTCKREFLNG